MNLNHKIRLILLCFVLALVLYGVNGRYISGFMQTRTQNIAASKIWQPKPGTSWYIQLEGKVDTSHNVDMYEIDLFYVHETNRQLIDELHGQGKIVICYFSAGTWENWRSDKDAFDTQLLGKTLGDWPDEKWLNINRIDQLAPIMRQRLDMAVTANCDGVLPDNVDGYTNDTGFPLTGEEQLRYNMWLAQEAHNRNLSIGLHNDLDQVSDLVAHFDWAANEQCFYYHECDRLAPFVSAGKAVFAIEYDGNVNEFCLDSQRRKFARLQMHGDRHLDGDALIQNCIN